MNIDMSKLLGMTLWVVKTSPQDPDKMNEVLEDHLKYQIGLEAQGIMFAAGPIMPAEGPGVHGQGMIVIRAQDADEARRIASEDPMHKSGARSFTLEKWIVNEGSLTVTVPFSAFNRPSVR